jgi:hypothetical protein
MQQGGVLPTSAASGLVLDLEYAVLRIFEARGEKPVIAIN